ncbi:hypothetical protein FRC19_002959 [Serendipita sp. 401]|nr:hypothetical protein FRC15_003626 [Serendipita sp. 397]KAG8812750.1 hypothetical protein FRC19_002959 [Serendipita sp. 401]KAG8843379.1 hypothetical protein FRC20_003981 [Serendipita sp. 405]
MSTKEGVEALCRAAHVSVLEDLRDDDTAIKLVQKLGGLALALVQAGSYCYRISSTTIPYFSFLDYLALLEVEEALLDDPTMSTLDDYGKSVHATLNISYEQLPEITRQFLHMAAYFHHSDIALLMLTTAVDNDFHWAKTEIHKRPISYQEARCGLSNLLKPPTKATILRLHDIVFSLQSFSLVTPTMSPTSVLLRFHPIVHSWARTKLPAESNTLFHQMATQVVAGCCHETLYRLHPTLMPHIHIMIDRHDILHPNDRQAFQSLLRDQGDYKLAEKLGKEQIAYMIGEFGNSHTFTAAAIGNLATVYTFQGRYEEAIDNYKHAAKLSEQLAVPDHPNTLTILENLATTYERQGALDEAESLYKDLIQRYRVAVGGEDVRTLSLMGSLSMVYGKQGKFQEAESLSLYVITAMSDILEENHPILLKERSKLGILYLRNYNYEEAEVIHRESMPLIKADFGGTNPLSVGAANMLAATLLEQERWEEAEALLTDALKTSRQKFGDKNPETIRIMRNMVTTYAGTGRYDEAEELMEDFLKLCISTAGPHHEDTIIAMHDLAYMYRRHEKLNKCVELASKCLIVAERVKGEQADLTLKTLELLGQAYTIMKDWKNANSTYTILLVRQRRKYGPSVTVGDTILYLSNVCFKDNQLADGLNLLTEAMDLADQLEGCEDPGLPDFYQQLVYMLHQIPGALSKIS